MDWLKTIFEKLESLLKWWIIILPWEQGIRIRLGSKVKILNKGIYFRIPYIDKCYVHHTRLHYINLSPQTLTTKDGENVTVAVIVGYALVDIAKMYNAISDFEATICGVVQKSNTTCVSGSNFNECSALCIETSALRALESNDWGGFRLVK